MLDGPFSWVVASRGYSLVATCGLLLEGASRCCKAGCLGRVGFGSCSTWAWVVAPGLQSTGSVVVVPGLSCSAARGSFLHHGWSLCLLLWQEDSFPQSHQEAPEKLLMLRGDTMYLQGKQPGTWVAAKAKKGSASDVAQRWLKGNEDKPSVISVSSHSFHMENTWDEL